MSTKGLKFYAKLIIHKLQLKVTKICIIGLGRVLDPAVPEFKMTKRLRINKYKADFTEFV